MQRISSSLSPINYSSPSKNMDNGGLNGFFVFFFSLILIAQILLSERPSEINFILLFHVAALGLILFFGFSTILVYSDRFTFDSLTLWTFFFLTYFYVVGVMVSFLNGVRLFGAIEFPYRISNLFLVFIIPFFVRREKDLTKLFVMFLIMLAGQILRDIFVGSIREQESLLVERLWSPTFTSVLFIATLPFSFSGLIVYWHDPIAKLIKRTLLIVLWALLVLKLFLTFSRVVWLIIFPLNIVGIYYLLRCKVQPLKDFQLWPKRITKLIILLAFTGVISMMAVAAFKPEVTGVILHRQEITGQMMSNRIEEYRNAIKEWLESPIWGKGFGNKSRFFKGNRYRSQDYIHNFIFQFLASSGVVGLTFFLTLLMVTFLKLFSLLKYSKSLLQTAILIGSILTLTNIVLLSSVQTTILKQDTYFIFSMIISFAIIIGRLQREKRQPERNQKK